MSKTCSMLDADEPAIVTPTHGGAFPVATLRRATALAAENDWTAWPCGDAELPDVAAWSIEATHTGIAAMRAVGRHTRDGESIIKLATELRIKDLTGTAPLLS